MNWKPSRNDVMALLMILMFALFAAAGVYGFAAAGAFGDGASHTIPGTPVIVKIYQPGSYPPAALLFGYFPNGSSWVQYCINGRICPNHVTSPVYIDACVVLQAQFTNGTKYYAIYPKCQGVQFPPNVNGSLLG